MRGIHCFANGRAARKAIVAAAFLAAASNASAQEVLRPALASWNGDVLTLHPEPNRQRILAAPAALWNIPAADQKADRALELTVTTSAPAELELSTVYGNKAVFVDPRRSVERGTAATVIWELPKSDAATSITLAARSTDSSATLTVSGMRLRPLDELDLATRLRAYNEHPLRPLSAAAPVKGGALMVEFEFPESLRSTLSKSQLFLEIESGGTSAREPISVALQPRKDRNAIIPDLFAGKLPAGASATLKARVILHSGTGEEQLAEVTIDAGGPTLPFFEVPLRSIEDFAALERNGEVVIYACAGDAGAKRGSANALLPVDTVWVAAGNGAEWVFTDPVLRTRRDGDWMAGGPTAISALLSEGVIHSLFTTVSATGGETLSYAGATGSVRLTPVAKNPIWTPEAASAETAPLLRGKALFELNGSRVFLELLVHPDGAPEVRTLVGNMKTRWNDLGSLPLRELPRETTSLTGYQDPGGAYYVLAGPTAKLYRATNPMRDWTPEPFVAPKWESMQFVHWNDGLWLFGIQRYNGRGVVVWAPVDRAQDSFRVREKFQFNPVPMAKPSTPPPPPPTPARAETYVR